MRAARPSGGIVFALLLFVVPLVTAADDWQFDGVGRIVAISDVHGDYDAMVATLTNAGILDASLGWAGGESHMVITGDLLDRGPDSRRVMDLVRGLEPLARDAGGAVHLLLGNAPGVEVIFRGKPVDMGSHQRGKVARLTLED